MKSFKKSLFSVIKSAQFASSGGSTDLSVHKPHPQGKHTQVIVFYVCTNPTQKNLHKPHPPTTVCTKPTHKITKHNLCAVSLEEFRKPACVFPVCVGVQGYLAQKKPPPPKTALGP